MYKHAGFLIGSDPEANIVMLCRRIKLHWRRRMAVPAAWHSLKSETFRASSGAAPPTSQPYLVIDRRFLVGGFTRLRGRPSQHILVLGSTQGRRYKGTVFSLSTVTQSAPISLPHHDHHTPIGMIFIGLFITTPRTLQKQHIHSVHRFITHGNPSPRPGPTNPKSDG